MTRFVRRPAPVVLAISLALVASSLWAQSAGGPGAPGAPREISIPAQPLGEALNAWARQTRTQIAVQQTLVVGKTAPAVSGNLTPMQALERLLAGSGLVALQDGPSTVIRRAPDAPGATLAAVTVMANADASEELPKAYAGNQVARGARLGVLGTTDVMDAPFNITSYTAKTIEDQQARSVAEVLGRTDPSVRLDFGEGTSVDALFIRGFPVVNDELSLNGLPGILGQYRVAPEFVERAEVLKGPSALLNGMSPGGAIGGAVNIVSKRATDVPITRLTTSYLSSSLFGVNADIGRRFGEDNAFGIRVNAATRDGDTARDDLTDKSRMASVGLDFRGTRLRASLDLLRQEQTMYGARGSVDLSGIGGPALAAPSGKRNFAQPWNYQDSTDDTVMARAEYDITDTLTVFGGIGHTQDRTTGIVSNPPAVDASGNFDFFSIPIDWRQKTTSSQFGLRGRFDTGSVRHQWSVSASNVKRDSDSLFYFSGLSGSAGSANIYRPTRYPAPTRNAPSGDPYTWQVRTSLPSYAISDTLSFADEKVLVTVGLRRQTVKSDSYTGFAATGLLPVTYDQSTTSPMAAVVVKPWQGVSLYANYIQGLSLGETAPDGTVNAGTVFPPYKSKQYETGVKFDVGQFTSTLSVFQITRPYGAVDPASNAFGINGEQRNRGIEFNVFGEIARGVRLLGGVSLIDAKLASTAGSILEGNRPVGVAEKLLTLGAEWDVSAVPGLTLVSRAMHTGDTYADSANLTRVPGWTVFDLGARYTMKAAGQPLTLRATLENAFDKRYWRQGEYAAILGMPRTLVLSATVAF